MLLRVEEDSGSQLDWHANMSAVLSVGEGAHTLHAVLLNDAGAATMTVAHAAFLARSLAPDQDSRGHPSNNISLRIKELYSLEARAERACREGMIRDDRGGVRTATSPCDALLQLAHELRLAGECRDASRLLARLVQLSAGVERKGDLAHATHVYPYLESAKCALAGRDTVAVARAIQTIHRLQPGYRLSNPYPGLTPQGGASDEDLELSRSDGSTFLIDPERILQADLRRVWHLVCEWTALEFVGPAGMLSYGSAVGNPGYVE